MSQNFFRGQKIPRGGNLKFQDIKDTELKIPFLKERQKVLTDRIKLLEETRSYLLISLTKNPRKTTTNPPTNSVELFRWLEGNYAEDQRPAMERSVAILDGMLEEFQFEVRKISGSFVKLDRDDIKAPLMKTAIGVHPHKIEPSVENISPSVDASPGQSLDEFYDRIKDAMAFFGVRWGEKEKVNVKGTVTMSHKDEKIEIKL